VRTCVSNRDADPPIQKLLHAVDILCTNYYEACQRKKRANSWNDCHSRIECLDSMSVIKNLLGFRACNFQHVSLASGRTAFSYCGAQVRRGSVSIFVLFNAAWCVWGPYNQGEHNRGSVAPWSASFGPRQHRVAEVLSRLGPLCVPYPLPDSVWPFGCHKAAY
jgi:hypothetical protein